MLRVLLLLALLCAVTCAPSSTTATVEASLGKAMKTSGRALDKNDDDDSSEDKDSDSDSDSDSDGVTTSHPTAVPTAQPTAVQTAEPTAETTPETTTDVILDIPETADEYGFSTLVIALEAAGLVPNLGFPNGPFTVFAPTNAAFDRLGEELLGCLLLPAYQTVLQDVLLYHVANGVFYAQDLVNDQVIEMVNGYDISTFFDEGTIAINDSADVVAADIVASNGIIHGIDRVLMPPELDVQKFLGICNM
jgi:uncharacterized surface protein with fasciclin (FAS1) repeats